MRNRAETGQRGERLVGELLEQRGYTIVGRNVRVGRLELDLIARRDRTIVFCEVRTRSSDRVAHPAESVNWRKVTRLRRAAAQWLASQPVRGDVRFDVASVLLKPGDPSPRIDYYEDAF